MTGKRIGILTGGGDVPGLNAAIRAAVYDARNYGMEVIGIRRGWKGLTHVNPVDGADPEYLLPLNRTNTRTVDRMGGTFLHSTRTQPSRMKVGDTPGRLQARLPALAEVSPGIVDFTPVVLENLEKLHLDSLIAIGGDDTLSYARRLHEEGFPVVCLPKTMDNDVPNTEYCIGFSTAITRAVDNISRQRTTVGSHERVGIFRVFGRDAGFTALYTAYVTGIRCCIPEHVFDLDRLLALLMEDKRENPSNYTLVVLSEGATWEGRTVQEYGDPDAYGHRKKMSVGEALSQEVKKRLNEETVVSDLTYDLRGGPPDFIDRLVATTFAAMAVECIADGGSGRMMALQKGCYVDAEIPGPGGKSRSVEVGRMYDTATFLPKRDRKAGAPIFLNTL
ncbi:MAG: ATP-dependent 6-phosphofructokinase [Bryobacterales bacterium]|nr:ATP-dependent 6-phosphofructokinase [Bryobacterales bacterium]